MNDVFEKHRWHPKKFNMATETDGLEKIFLFKYLFGVSYYICSILGLVPDRGNLTMVAGT